VKPIHAENAITKVAPCLGGIVSSRALGEKGFHKIIELSHPVIIGVLT
jgi:hypothetical protein